MLLIVTQRCLASSTIDLRANGDSHVNTNLMYDQEIEAVQGIPKSPM
jgi:hypothetical protein